MSRTPPGEGHPTPDNLDDSKTESKEQRNVTEIAALLAKKLTHDEMYDVVLAIEDGDFHEAVIRQWQDLAHPEPNVEK